MADTSNGSSTTRDNILRLARKLPAAPHIFGRLGLLLGNMNADLDNIVRLVAVDSGLTGRVIRMSNSVFYRGDEPVRSLDEAVNRVGFREMHKMVGVAMSEQLFQGGLPVYNLTAEEMWENSVVTALAMENVARVVGEDEGEAYTLGLLRPVGKLVLDMLLEVEHPGVCCPDSDTLELPKWERAWAAITSNEAGAMILEEWKMPEPMHTGVLHHYGHDSEGNRMAALLLDHAPARQRFEGGSPSMGTHRRRSIARRTDRGSGSRLLERNAGSAGNAQGSAQRTSRLIKAVGRFARLCRAHEFAGA
jgi:HD-like signal output (HDOD) protein